MTPSIASEVAAASLRDRAARPAGNVFRPVAAIRLDARRIVGRRCAWRARGGHPTRARRGAGPGAERPARSARARAALRERVVRRRRSAGRPASGGRIAISPRRAGLRWRCRRRPDSSSTSVALDAHVLRCARHRERAPGDLEHRHVVHPVADDDRLVERAARAAAQLGERRALRGPGSRARARRTCRGIPCRPRSSTEKMCDFAPRRARPRPHRGPPIATAASGSSPHALASASPYTTRSSATTCSRSARNGAPACSWWMPSLSKDEPARSGRERTAPFADLRGAIG